MARPCPPTVHSSLSSVLAALTAERDQLRDLHQDSELSRIGVRLGVMVAGERRWPEAETAGLGVQADLGWEGGVARAVSAWQRREGFILSSHPLPAGL